MTTKLDEKQSQEAFRALYVAMINLGADAQAENLDSKATSSPKRLVAGLEITRASGSAQ